MYETSPGKGQEWTRVSPNESKSDNLAGSTTSYKLNAKLRQYYEDNRGAQKELQSMPSHSCWSEQNQQKYPPLLLKEEGCKKAGTYSDSDSITRGKVGYSKDKTGGMTNQIAPYMRDLTLAINMERYRTKEKVIRLSHRLNLCAKMCNHDLVQGTKECDMTDMLKQLG